MSIDFITTTMHGTILNIQRFSLHDGPGIRTVVYLKGCPLHCQWCSNPESIRPQRQLGYDAERCTQCMDCVKYCKYGVLRNKNGKLVVAFKNCIVCGECIDKCMEDALNIYGNETTACKVMATVEKDVKYYREASGGVTFSGGDPFYQSNFLISLLRESRKRSIHTCIETSGYAEQTAMAEAMPLTDIFLFDYKVTDPNVHLKSASKTNKKIIDNLHFLSDGGSKIILRCILIPGVNDNTHHFRAITKLSNELQGIIQTDLIPYHDFARTKYSKIGEEYHLSQKSVPAEQARKWLNQLQSMGCNNVGIQ
jgi:pyruvate formate lyase activating enzyme